MKSLTSKIPIIILSASGLLAALSSNAKADSFIVRGEAYEHPHYWHGDHMRYEERGEHIYYRESISHAEPGYYRENYYRECPQSSTQYQGCSHQYYYTR